MTEPDWAVVQEVETVTGDFLTEPGVPFYRIVIDGYCADFDHRQAAENFVAAIQRAFEERERKLRETGQFLLDRLVDHEVRMTSDEDGREWLGHVAPAMARFRQALKDTPDAG